MSKNNKTNHVLNLLSSGMKDQGEIDRPPVDPRGEKAEKKNLQQDNLSDISVVTGEKNARETELAAKIKDNLKKELESENPEITSDLEAQEALEEEVAIEERVEKEPENPKLSEEIQPDEDIAVEEKVEKESEDPKLSEEIQSDEDIAVESNIEKELEESESVEEIQPDEDFAIEEKVEKEPEESFRIINVMEEIVLKSVDEYIEKMGCCNCSRCRADVIALTLTNLPSKYIVAEFRAQSPLLDYYSKVYNGELIVALTRACMKVTECPHH